MDHRGSGLVVDNSLITVDSVYSVTICTRTRGCQQCMQYTQLAIPITHFARCWYVLTVQYQITHAIQIRPGLPSWDVQRMFRPAYAEFDAPSPPSAAHALLLQFILQQGWAVFSNARTLYTAQTTHTIYYSVHEIPKKKRISPDFTSNSFPTVSMNLINSHVRQECIMGMEGAKGCKARELEIIKLATVVVGPISPIYQTNTLIPTTIYHIL